MVRGACCEEEPSNVTGDFEIHTPRLCLGWQAGGAAAATPYKGSTRHKKEQLSGAICELRVRQPTGLRGRSGGGRAK